MGTARKIPLIESKAAFSPHQVYRYYLLRRWDRTRPLCIFAMLNPSTADLVQDDPTVRRCQYFANDWGHGGIIVLNLFALRSTDPRALRQVEYDPVGPNNQYFWEQAIQQIRGEHYVERPVVICAWGTHAAFRDQDVVALQWLENAGPVDQLCLGTTKDGYPKHPLYVPRTAIRRTYEGRT